MAETQSPSVQDIRYGGFTRFELELEFVQSLGNPLYLNHLAATQKVFDNPEFIAYIDYLQYFQLPQYAKYIAYPGPALRNLELLKQETFRKHIVDVGLAQAMFEQGIIAGKRDQS
ncbi:SOH1-domain-containing protein [Pseudovirgaria hyperparasitica]|uniref:Mediator of RNA polymerase II transcription subunit 31 n=1 Tax=Pseudovirgaria hyperparasitica TaxID=470096 RepID=A0A6A6WAD5_9PEZI|nr:SOH1-domain-containing protein [Pseudovirgaria hyperparasitica]KAF2758081.1 SOH1-domain-containing protein [Pseudovirgaria hyperparasitica]